MKSYPRVWKGLMWGGLVVTVLLVVVWVGSGWWSVHWLVTSRCSIAVNAGLFSIIESSVDLERAFVVQRRHSWGVRLWKWWHDSGMLRQAFLPIWIPTLVSALITGAAWRLNSLARRRERMGKCSKCGYDLGGLASGAVCPECGAAAALPN